MGVQCCLNHVTSRTHHCQFGVTLCASPAVNVSAWNGQDGFVLSGENTTVKLMTKMPSGRQTTQQRASDFSEQAEYPSSEEMAFKAMGENKRKPRHSHPLLKPMDVVASGGYSGHLSQNKLGGEDLDTVLSLGLRYQKELK
ncbi:hypothetical protein llap_1881 [Limosa lapponica baueri]|uniref:Uncharacterized protein n=1 Tax=Limosa lapponica baueri TaxID=1758121 RepID=A0A2I0UP76_LIMLA|nr:hypothetical protein llap_1881 [Limosa lapponica baueri]